MSDSLDQSLSRAILEQLPVGIMLQENLQIQWVNRTLCEILLTSEDELVGLTPETAANGPLVSLFETSDRVGVTDASGEKSWYKRQQLQLPESSRELQVFIDVTREAKLENEVDRLLEGLKKLETKHPVTGLLNRKTILQALNTQVSRSRRYENPLALLRLSFLPKDPDCDITETLRSISQMLKDQLRWADQIGMIDETTFLIILPETSLSAAKELATKLSTDRTTLGDTHKDWSVKFGAAGWQKGDDPEKLLNRVKVDQELSCIALLS